MVFTAVENAICIIFRFPHMNNAVPKKSKSKFCPLQCKHIYTANMRFEPGSQLTLLAITRCTTHCMTNHIYDMIKAQ